MAPAWGMAPECMDPAPAPPPTVEPAPAIVRAPVVVAIALEQGERLRYSKLPYYRSQSVIRLVYPASFTAAGHTGSNPQFAKSNDVEPLSALVHGARGAL